MSDELRPEINAMAVRDAAERWRRVRDGEYLHEIYDNIHPDHIGARDADCRKLADAYIAAHPFDEEHDDRSQQSAERLADRIDVIQGMTASDAAKWQAALDVLRLYRKGE